MENETGTLAEARLKFEYVKSQDHVRGTVCIY